MTTLSIHAELIAVLAAVTDNQPRVMIIDGKSLPSGPLETAHRSLQQGLRDWVKGQTKQAPGYLEQLYTFADSDRLDNSGAGRTISISYLGLMREQSDVSVRGRWQSWYDYFPWEDHRASRPTILSDMLQALQQWASQPVSSAERQARSRRIALAFGDADIAWNEDRVLQRYELLYEAGLVAESPEHDTVVFGTAMAADHRRILATAIARLRAKIKYRPVVFELMPAEFTLLQLQRVVEALAGLTLHKPNFRRQIEQQDLVEETGKTESETSGRPAKLFRFRHIVREEREFAGTKLPISRN